MMLETVRAMMAEVSAVPGDWQVRLIYADVLEESGMDKEAASQRRKAKAIRFPGNVHLSSYMKIKLRRYADGSNLPLHVWEGSLAPAIWGIPLSGPRSGSWEYIAVGGQRERDKLNVRIIARSLHFRVGVMWLIKEGYIK